MPSISRGPVSAWKAASCIRSRTTHGRRHISVTPSYLSRETQLSRTTGEDAADEIHDVNAMDTLLKVVREHTFFCSEWVLGFTEGRVRDDRKAN